MPRGRTVKNPEKVAEAIRLRATQDLTYHQIGARFGVCGNAVYRWINDPDGSKRRAYKVGRYGGLCIDCGDTTRTGAARCRRCAAIERRRV